MNKNPSWVDLRSRALPDYSLFPQVPDWNLENMSTSVYSPDSGRPSVYVHLPFCDDLCVFCGCNVVITPWQSEVERRFLFLLREELALKLGAHHYSVDELFIGGGSPNFFSVDALSELREILSEYYQLSDARWHFELDPRKTNREHLEFFGTFKKIRLQWGVQDFDPQTQKNIHRVFSLGQMERLLAACSTHIEHGLDFIWGLPNQSLNKFLAQFKDLNPWNLSILKIYRYIEPPWNKKGQRFFAETTSLPSREIFKGLLEVEGQLEELGWWHAGRGAFYPKKERSLISSGSAFLSGWCPATTSSLHGFGVGACSSSENGHSLNHKAYPLYTKDISGGLPPVSKTHRFTQSQNEKQKWIQKVLVGGRICSSSEALPLEPLQVFMEEGWLSERDGGYEISSAWLWPWVIAALDSNLLSRWPDFPSLEQTVL